MAYTEKGILQNIQIGSNGGKYISTTDATTPASGYVFTEIYVVTNATMTLEGNINNITGVAVTAGQTIKGRYTKVTLASGSVIAYNGV